MSAPTSPPTWVLRRRRPRELAHAPDASDWTFPRRIVNRHLESKFAAPLQVHDAWGATTTGGKPTTTTITARHDRRPEEERRCTRGADGASTWKADAMRGVVALANNRMERGSRTWLCRSAGKSAAWHLFRKGVIKRSVVQLRPLGFVPALQKVAAHTMQEATLTGQQQKTMNACAFRRGPTSSWSSYQWASWSSGATKSSTPSLCCSST